MVSHVMSPPQLDEMRRQMAYLQAQLQRQQGMGQSDTVWSGDPLATSYSIVTNLSISKSIQLPNMGGYILGHN